MQKLTDPQADAVLDIVDQCRQVSHAYEQRQAGERDRSATDKASGGEKVAASTQAAYDQAIAVLTDLYVAASALHVEDNVLMGVVAHNLPKDLSLVLQLPTPAA